MRVILKEYAKGGRGVTETSDDGGEFVTEWVGPRKVGERVCAYVDVACDSTDSGIDRLLEGLTWLSEEIKKRRGQYSEKKTSKKKKVSA